MIRSKRSHASRQDWVVGATVKAGFMTLVVKAKMPPLGVGLPGAYILANAAGTKLYEFVPHNGVRAVTVGEAHDLLARVEAKAARVAKEAIAKAIADANVATSINALFQRGEVSK